MSPASQETRQQQVLRWYVDTLVDTPAAHAAASTEDWVIDAGEPATSYIAEALAVDLGRGYVRLADPCVILEREQPRSAILVAGPERLTYEWLTYLQRRFDAAGVLLGFLTGPDPDSLAFLAAKLRHARQQRRPLPDLLAGIPTTPLEPHDRLRSLARDHRLISIFSHSEGAHCLVDGVVLCGLIDEQECGETPILGGCTSDDCKRRVMGDFERFLVRELRCEALLLCCCSGLMLAREVYHSDSSVAGAALAGYPATVMAQLGSAYIDENDARFLHQLLLRGARFGDVCRFFNSRVTRSNPTYCCMIGDPLTSLVESPVAIDQLLESEDVSRLPIMLDGEPLLVSPAHDHCVSFFPRADDLLVLHPELTRAQFDAYIDRSGDLQRHRRDVEATLRQLPTLQQLAAALSSIARDFDPAPPLAELTAIIAMLANVVGSSTSLIHHLGDRHVRVPQLDNHMAIHQTALNIAHKLLVALVEGWLLQEQLGEDRLAALLNWGMLRSHDPDVPERCSRCRAPLTPINLCGLDGILIRRSFDCPNCGLAQIRPVTEPDLWLQARLDPERRGLLLRGAGQPSAEPRDVVVLEHRDITRKRTTSAILSTTAFLDEGHTFELPDDAGRDMHTLKAIRVRGLGIAYSRTITPV